MSEREWFLVGFALGGLSMLWLMILDRYMKSRKQKEQK